MSRALLDFTIIVIIFITIIAVLLDIECLHHKVVSP